jgi:hypothetical protein
LEIDDLMQNIFFTINVQNTKNEIKKPF